MTLGPSIVSLLGSATEIICALDLRENLVGRSHECDFPSDVLTLPILSTPKVDPTLPGHEIDRQVRTIAHEGLSVYRLDVEELERLQPGLIVTQDHCEVCAISLTDVEDALCRAKLDHASICCLNPGQLDDVCADFQKIADAAQAADRGKALVQLFRDRLAEVERITGAAEERPRVLLLEWLEPPMVAGGWMPELARIAGGQPVIVEDPKAFKTVEWTDLASEDPDVVVIVPCGFSVERTLAELARPSLADTLRSIPAVGRGNCYVADGNAYFNRPGPRLAESAEILAALIHPTVASAYGDVHRNAFMRWS